MDFKANIDEISTVCTKIDNNTNTLQQEINNAKKTLQGIPSSWNDVGTKVFIQKAEELLKSLQTLSSAYKSITTETKKAVNKYQSLDSELSKKIQTGTVKKSTEPVTTPKTEPKTTPKTEPKTTPKKKEEKEEVLYEVNGISLIRRGTKVYYKSNGEEHFIADTSIPDNVQNNNVTTFDYNGMTVEINNGQISVKGTPTIPTTPPINNEDYYVKWYNGTTGEYQYVHVPPGFNGGQIELTGGASLVVKRQNKETGQYEYIDASSINDKGAK